MFSAPAFPSAVPPANTRAPRRGTALEELNNDANVYAHADLNRDGHDDLIALSVDLGAGRDLLVRLGDEALLYGAAARVYSGLSGVRPAAADFNGDRRVDLAYVRLGGDLVVSAGRGDGTFNSPRLVLAGPRSPLTQVYLNGADLDRDGDVDLTISTKLCLLNNGDGEFIEVASPTPDEGWPLAPPTDFNGDGFPDLFAVYNWPSNPAYGLALNLGNGLFGPPDFSFGPAQQVQLFAAGLADIADVNGDHEPDVVTLSDGGHDAFLSLGDGTFEQLDANVPVGIAESMLRVMDIYGDYNPDLISFNATEGIVLHVGLGDGTFDPQPTQILRSGNVFDGFAQDFNADGVDDLFVGGAIFVRLANGQFDLDGRYFAGDYDLTGIAALDTNDDDLPDIVAFGDGHATTLLGDGHGAFEYYATSGRGIGRGERLFASSRTQLVDFNLDGRADVLYHRNFPNSDQVIVAINRGDGTLDIEPINFPLAADVSRPADLDQDGFPDFVTTVDDTSPGTVSTYAYFGAANTPLSSRLVYNQPIEIEEPLIADLDGDGYGSVVVSTANGDIASLETQADRTFVGGTLLAAAAAFAAYDLDSDGFDDLVVRDASNGDLAFYYGRADGTLDPGPAFALDLDDHDTQIAIARLGGSADFFVLANTQDASGGYDLLPWRLAVLRSTGLREFEIASQVRHAGRTMRDWLIDDYTLDGKPDVIFVADDMSSVGFIEVFPGNGDGTFRNPFNFARSQPTAYATVSGDWDRDGDADIATLVLQSEIEVKLNHLAP